MEPASAPSIHADEPPPPTLFTASSNVSILSDAEDGRLHNMPRRLAFACVTAFMSWNHDHKGDPEAYQDFLHEHLPQYPGVNAEKVRLFFKNLSASYTSRYLPARQRGCKEDFLTWWENRPRRGRPKKAEFYVPQLKATINTSGTCDMPPRPAIRRSVSADVATTSSTVSNTRAKGGLQQLVMPSGGGQEPQAARSKKATTTTKTAVRSRGKIGRKHVQEPVIGVQEAEEARPMLERRTRGRSLGTLDGEMQGDEEKVDDGDDGGERKKNKPMARRRRGVGKKKTGKKTNKEPPPTGIESLAALSTAAAAAPTAMVVEGPGGLAALSSCLLSSAEAAALLGSPAAPFGGLVGASATRSLRRSPDYDLHDHRAGVLLNSRRVGTPVRDLNSGAVVFRPRKSALEEDDEDDIEYGFAPGRGFGLEVEDLSEDEDEDDDDEEEEDEGESMDEESDGGTCPKPLKGLFPSSSAKARIAGEMLDDVDVSLILTDLRRSSVVPPQQLPPWSNSSNDNSSLITPPPPAARPVTFTPADITPPALSLPQDVMMEVEGEQLGHLDDEDGSAEAGPASLATPRAVYMASKITSLRTSWANVQVTMTAEQSEQLPPLPSSGFGESER